MLNLLGFDEILNILPFFLMPVVFFGIVVAVVVSIVVRRVKSEKRRQEVNESQARYPFADINTRTDRQREYLASKRREQSDRNVGTSYDSHGHSGRQEAYEPIVGSLGEVNDEGCDELDGVRLIEHDESYCDDPDHLLPEDNTDIQKAIVLGEALNTPRFKEMYRRK